MPCRQIQTARFPGGVLEKNRPRRSIAFCIGTALFSALLLCGCGLGPSGEGALEVIGSYPSDNEANVRAYGRYFIIFNEPVQPAAVDELLLSFEARVSASAETLFVERLNTPAFDRSDTIEIKTLSRPGGSQGDVLYKVAFRTAPGEHEDNGTLSLADTLRPGQLLDGICGNSDASPSDADWFVIAPSGNDSFEVAVSLIDTLPAVCVRYPAYEPTDLGKSPPVRIRANDTLRLFMTNAYPVSGHDVRYMRNAWYRIAVNPL